MVISTVRLLAVLGAALIGMHVSQAAAQGRRALVIGADDYRNVPKLQKAAGDARAMKAELEDVGFEVDLLINPDRAAFNSGISEFTRKLKAGDIALIHYSGHGVALDGENYLLPVDAPSPSRVDKEGLKVDSFSLMGLIERVRATGSRVQIAIVDACRDNPYARAGTRSIGTRGGLVEPHRKPVKGQGGFFIMFSAGFGQTAADRLNDSDPEPTSVYTRTLLRKIKVEGKPITDLAREVREDVEALAATVNHEQRPAYYDELSGPLFYFSPPGSGGPVASAPPQQPRPQALLTPPQLPQAPPSAPAPPLASVPVSPSFDCGRARSADELAICANAQLAALDRALSQAYYALADTLSGPALASLRSAQGQWLAQRGHCGASPACIDATYRTRIAELQGAGRQAALAPVPPRALAPARPSFDCAKARKPDEKAICADAALAARDVRLSEVFGQARARLPNAAERQLLSAQAQWLAQRGRCQSDIRCIALSYDQRIRQLEALLAGR